MLDFPQRRDVANGAALGIAFVDCAIKGGDNLGGDAQRDEYFFVASNNSNDIDHCFVLRDFSQVERQAHGSPLRSVHTERFGNAPQFATLNQPYNCLPRPLTAAGWLRAGYATRPVAGRLPVLGYGSDEVRDC